MKITATIITLNEERNIARAIESLRCCDEILIVDSGSTDRTVELAEKLGARVLEAGWLGYAAQKNWAAEHATHDWILSLDADEALERGAGSRNLESQEKRPGVRRLHHAPPGALPGPLDLPLRLVSRPQSAPVPTATRPSGWAISCMRASQPSGRVGHLESNILHFTCESLSEHVKTMDRYTTLAAQELAARKVKVPLSRLIVDPAWTFVKTYFFQRGFLDGPEGLTIAHMAAFYTFLKYSKARNMS